MRMRDRNAGSMTVEAAIIMPIFVIVVFTMIMLTKLVYIHALVQQGLVQIAKEAATFSYVLSEVLRVNELDEEINDVLSGNVAVTDLDGKLERAERALNESLGQQGQVMATIDLTEEISGDPFTYFQELGMGALSSMGLNLYRDLLGEGTGMIARVMLPAYVGQSAGELDRLLLLLGVEGGLGGIRIKGRLPVKGESPTLDVMAAYSVQLEPPLAFFLNDKVVIQRASCVPWTGA